MPRKKYRTFLRKLGRNIRAERNRRGYTQEQLAEMAGVSWRMLQQVEAGSTNNLVTTTARIQAALQCPWELLIPPVTVTRQKPRKAPHP